MTTSTRLWELSDDIQTLESAITLIQDNQDLSDEEQEIQLEETFNQWLETGESFKEKAEKLAGYIRHQEALAEARKNEAKRIQTLAKQAENGAARLRKYLVAQMVRSDVKKIEGVTVKIGLRKKQPSVLINVEPEKLPAEYVKVSYKPDLTAIKKLLKSEAVEWASLSDGQEYSVTIR
ncbi:Gp157 protein [Xenococcus sp. PCC 7305]|uniref:siphovirus Gp157 family protein n=1 Tax=Xenococcus sp. PCC 7305 TaxID=102125 RepID=UPI0002ABAB83|nr:siphovirus Gp157 family protein [Xenococcus sp. PCC 7305]ELS03465.1 Gp157 protein [Xenococcus sp. PCC 7305]